MINHFLINNSFRHVQGDILSRSNQRFILFFQRKRIQKHKDHIVIFRVNRIQNVTGLFRENSSVRFIIVLE